MSVDLNNLKDKCRLCFQRTESARKSAIIDKEIQEKFLNYTNVELIMSSNYSSSVCKQCLTTLNVHIKYRENMIANQRKLYSKVESHSFVNVNIKEEPTDLHETFSNFNFVELCAVKAESDHDNRDDSRHEYMENEFELQLETPAVQEIPKSTKRKYCNYSEDQIQSAISAVSSGQMTFREAGQKFKIPRQTLARKIQQGFYTRKMIKSVEDGQSDSVTLFQSLEVPQKSLDACGETLHVCDLCGFETLIKINLTHHMTSHSDGQDITKVTCSLCQKVFLTRHIKMMHERNHCKTSKGEFSCEKCGMNFTTKLHMINHHNADHGNFPCENCDKVFLRQIDLYVHSKSHGSGGQKVSCKVCRGIYVKGIAYKIHLATHRQTSDDELGTIKKAGTKKICKYCSKVMLNRHINRHEKIHENKLNNIFLQCDQCSYKTNAKYNIVNHVKTHCQDVSERVCFFCSKVCTSIQTKKLHERDHIEPKGEFACETCGRVFEMKFKLDHHVNMAHITGNFPCNKCDRVFDIKLRLQRHKESHKPARVKIACEVCGKLIIKRFYNVHLRNHGPGKQKCSIEGCTKIYRSKSAVAHHIENDHEESKNIKCPECASVYPNEGKLRRHISRSHTAPSFFCEVEGCSYKQTRKEYLKLHLRNHRDIDARLRDELLKKLGGRSKD